MKINDMIDLGQRLYHGPDLDTQQRANLNRTLRRTLGALGYTRPYRFEADEGARLVRYVLKADLLRAFGQLDAAKATERAWDEVREGFASEREAVERMMDERMMEAQQAPQLPDPPEPLSTDSELQSLMIRAIFWRMFPSFDLERLRTDMWELEHAGDEMHPYPDESNAHHVVERLAYRELRSRVNAALSGDLSAYLGKQQPDQS